MIFILPTFYSGLPYQVYIIYRLQDILVLCQVRATERSKIKLKISTIWEKNKFSDDFVMYRKHKNGS